MDSLVHQMRRVLIGMKEHLDIDSSALVYNDASLDTKPTVGLTQAGLMAIADAQSDIHERRGFTI